MKFSLFTLFNVYHYICTNKCDKTCRFWRQGIPFYIKNFVWFYKLSLCRHRASSSSCLTATTCVHSFFLSRLTHIFLISYVIHHHPFINTILQISISHTYIKRVDILATHLKSLHKSLILSNKRRQIFLCIII